MRKITTLLTVCLIASTGFAQKTWMGYQSEKKWDHTTNNWGMKLPNGIFVPSSFNVGETAVFSNDTAVGITRTEKIAVSKEVKVGEIQFNSSYDMTLSRETSSNFTTDFLSGDGTLVKEGTGTFAIGVENKLVGGSIVREGVLRMNEASIKANKYNPFGSKVVLENGILDLATSKSKSSVADYIYDDTTIEIPEGKTGTVRFSQFTYFFGSFIGAGELTLALEGERGYLAAGKNTSDTPPNWSKYTNKTINVEYFDTGKSGDGGYLVLVTNKNYDYSTMTGIDSTFYNKSIVLGANTRLSSESGTKAYAIGELKAADESAIVGGYYKNSETPATYYIVGGLNTDVVFPGQFSRFGTSSKMKTGLIKVGTGTYTLTNNNNFFYTLGLEVKEGRILLCDEQLKGTYFGSAGNFAIVRENAAIGGTGRMHGNLDVYGNLEPGANGIGTLMVSDSLALNPLSKYETSLGYSIKYQYDKDGTPTDKTYTYKNGGTSKPTLTFHPKSTSEFEIKSKDAYDKVVIRGNAKFVSEGSNKPKIKVTIPGAYDIKDGDKFEILTAYTCTNETNLETDYFDIEYPNIEGVTWTKEIKVEDLDTEEFEFKDKFDDDISGQEYTNNIIVKTSKYSIIVKATGSGVGIKDDKVAADVVTLYPNPTYSDFKVSASDVEINSIEVYNLQGQLVKTQVANGSEVTVGVSEIPAGVYIVKVYTTSGIAVQKLVKK